MSSTITTPYMDLILPVPTEEPGPEWATELNTAFGSVDSHNHTTGYGAQVPTAGLNINADLTFNSYNATQLRSARFNNQSSALVLAADINSVYVAGGNLYYNNASGTSIQLTAGSALNAASIGGIGGDYATSTASVFYTAASVTFSFTSNTNTPANINAGSIIIREPAASSNAITLKSPVSLASGYDITLPTALPASTRVLSMTSAGVLATGTAGTIIAADLATDSVTTSKIMDSNVTSAKIQASVNLTGTPTSVGKNIVVSNTNAAASLAIVRGTVDAAGSLTGGEGFSIVHSSTGIYTLNFTSAFVDTPVAVVSAVQAAVVCTTQNLSTLAVQIRTYDNLFALSDAAFSVIIIGQRA